MQIGCGNGLGLGLVSDELLAGERTDSWTWSHTGRKLSFLFFFLFFSLSLFPWRPLDAYDYTFLGYCSSCLDTLCLILSQRPRPVRHDYIGGSTSKKHLQLFLSLTSSTAGVQARPLSYNAPNVTT
jgi:hypothetical protein